MRLGRIVFFALAAPLFFISAAQAAPKEATPTISEFMARFEGTSEGQANGQQSTLLALQMLNNGKNVRLAVPNEAATGKTPGPPKPKKDLMGVISKLKPGAVVKFSAEPGKTGPIPLLVTIEEYETKPGEDTPNGYVYSKTYDKPTGKITLTLVVLTKFGVEHQFSLPVKKNDKGEPEQDPELVAQLAKIPINSSVWISSQLISGKPTLTAIEPYVDPQLGKMGKIGDTEIDGKKVPSAEIETDSGKTVTVLVPLVQKGKMSVPDSALNAALHKFRPGAQVTFRTHEDGDKLWLREITPAPSRPAAAPEKKPEHPKKK